MADNPIYPVPQSGPIGSGQSRIVSIIPADKTPPNGLLIKGTGQDFVPIIILPQWFKGAGAPPAVLPIQIPLRGLLQPIELFRPSMSLHITFPDPHVGTEWLISMSRHRGYR